MPGIKKSVGEGVKEEINRGFGYWYDFANPNVRPSIHGMQSELRHACVEPRVRLSCKSLKKASEYSA